MSSTSCVVPGDTTWVLVASVLVFTMCPALAFFEGGMLRSKNVLSIHMQVFAGFAILMLCWFIFGFSLVFGQSCGGVIGNLGNALMLRTLYND